MVWAQGLVSFLIWLAVGYFTWRGGFAALRTRPRASRGSRIALALGLLIGGAILMLGGLFLIQSNQGIANNSLLLWAWLAVTVLGAAFVWLQTTAGLLMISLMLDPVTAPGPTTSNTRSTEEE